MSQPIHGTVVAYAGAGVLIAGASGTGKSRLAAELMAFGGRLVGDDQIQLVEQAGMLMAAAVPQLSGVLELRGIGLVRVNDIIPKHVLHLAIELTPDATERLPAPQTKEFLGRQLPFLRLAPLPQTSAASLILYIKAMQEGRILPQDWRPGA